MEQAETAMAPVTCVDVDKPRCDAGLVWHGWQENTEPVHQSRAPSSERQNELVA